MMLKINVTKDDSFISFGKQINSTDLSYSRRSSGDDDHLSGQVFAENGTPDISERLETEVARKEEEECGDGENGCENVEKPVNQIHEAIRKKQHTPGKKSKWGKIRICA